MDRIACRGIPHCKRNLVKPLLFSLALFASIRCVQAALPTSEANRIADAIFRVEGGHKTKHPYGILSVQTSNPRKVCLNTIQHTHNRWLKAGKPSSFLIFLADRYCPPSADPVGNRNWRRNITLLLK